MKMETTSQVLMKEGQECSSKPTEQTITVTTLYLQNLQAQSA